MTTSERSLEGDWIDVSIPVRSGMIRWPGDPPVAVEQASSLEGGDACNVSRLSLGSHAGTHMDAPLHFIAGGTSIDRIPLSIVVGPARVVETDGTGDVGLDRVRSLAPRAGERLLFKTRNSGVPWPTLPFDEGFASLSVEAARYLADRSVALVGVDYLSVSGYRSDMTAVHRALLEAGVWILEGLDLSGVLPRSYDLVCLPLKLQGADGAPCRAILRPRGGRKGSSPSPRSRS